MPNRRRRRWGGKKEGEKEMRTREGEILAVAWHRATLIHCIEQSRWVIIHTQAWTISHTRNTYTPSVPEVDHTAPGVAVLRLALPSEIKEEEASVQSILGVPPTLYAIHVVNTYRRCIACQRQGIHYSEYNKAEVRET